MYTKARSQVSKLAKKALRASSTKGQSSSTKQVEYSPAPCAGTQTARLSRCVALRTLVLYALLSLRLASLQRVEIECRSTVAGSPCRPNRCKWEKGRRSCSASPLSRSKQEHVNQRRGPPFDRAVGAVLVLLPKDSSPIRSEWPSASLSEALLTPLTPMAESVKADSRRRRAFFSAWLEMRFSSTTKDLPQKALPDKNQLAYEHVALERWWSD